MKIGKREKIVIILISMLLVITLIHFLLYRPQSNALSEVNKNWQAAAAQYQEYYKYDLSPKELTLIKDEVDRLEYNYDSAKQLLHINHNFDTTRGIQAILDALQTLKQTEKSAIKTTVKVFANWNITDDVPGLDPKRIPDYLDDLKSKKAVLRLPNLDPTLKQEFTSKYFEIKRKLGFNMVELNQMPPIVSYLKQLKIFNFIKSNLGDYKISEKELFDLLEISTEDKKDIKSYLFILHNANELLKLAIDSEVENVMAINLYNEEPIYRESEKPAAPAPTQPQPGVFPGFPGGPAGIEGPALPPELAGPGAPGMGPAGARGRFPGGFPGYAPQQPQQPTTPQAKPIATAWPIEIKLKANNLAFNKFLYAVSNIPALAELKEIEVQAKEEGKVEVRCKIYYYTGFTAI
ncbi:MAG: collagen-like protein [bacterium]|nr:collagen-like protein [bacterium]